MKCNVCGNELNNDTVKCEVCGTVVDKKQSLAETLSNISSMARALKNNREKMLKDSELKSNKLSGSLDIDDLYVEEVDLESKLIQDNEINLDEFYNMYASSDEDDDVEDVRKKRNPIKSYSKVADSQSEVLDTTEDVDTNSELEEDDKIDDEYISEDDIVYQNADEEDNDSDVVEDETVDDESYNDEVVEDDESSNDSSDSDIGADIENITSEGGYIKESEIEKETEEVEEEEEKKDDVWVNFNISETEEDPQPVDNDIEAQQPEKVVETSLNQQEITPEVVQEDEIAEDDFVDLEPETENNSLESAREATEGTTEAVENFSSVKAEDVPYTQLQEVKSSVGDDKPIVIDDKDVMTANSAQTQGETDGNSKKGKVKGFSVSAFFATIFLLLAVVAGGSVLVYLLLAKEAIDTNVVFTFLIKLFNMPNMLEYFSIGGVVLAVLSLIFGIRNLIKRRSLSSKLLVFFNFLVTAGLIACYSMLGIFARIFAMFGI